MNAVMEDSKTVDERLLPTDTEVAEYQERGWYVSKQLFTDEEIQAVVEGTDRFYQGELVTDGLPETMIESKVPHHFPKSGLRKSDYASFYVPALAHIVRKPILAAIAARLSGSSTIRLWHDQLLWKDPQTPGLEANVGWHTDRSYWLSCSSDEMLTGWVPFHDCDERVGTITMFDGSHRWPYENNFENGFFRSDLDAVEESLATAGHEVRKIPMILKQGQVSFHHCRLIHGSGPNLSSSPRRSVAVHLQDETNRYREFIHPRSGRVAGHCNQRFCRMGADGKPDFADPDVCPTLFPSMAKGE